jgi:hypothetical protein
MKESAEKEPQSSPPVATTLPILGEVIDYKGHKVIKGAHYDLERKISIGTARDNAVVGSVTVREAVAGIKTQEMGENVQRAEDAAEDIATELWHVLKDFRESGRFDIDRSLNIFSWMSWEVFHRLPTELTQLYRTYNLHENWGRPEIEDAVRKELKTLGWRHAKTWKLKGFVWTGVFGARTENGLLEPSGLMCVDFDKIGQGIDEFMAKLQTDELIFAAQRSPSRKGVKIEVRVPDDAVSDPIKFRACFETFQRYVERQYPGASVSVDKHAKARNQLCFFMHDPASFYFVDSYILLPDDDLLQQTKTLPPKPLKRSEFEKKVGSRTEKAKTKTQHPPAEWMTIKSALEKLEPWLSDLPDGERYGTWTGLCFSVGHWAKLPENEQVKVEAKDWLLNMAERIYGNHSSALANAFDKADGQKTIGSLFSLAKEHGWTPPWHNALSDPRPKVRLPGTNRLLSDFAIELAEHLNDKDIYVCNGEVVLLQERSLKPIKAQAFRTWCEQHVLCYIQKGAGENTLTFKQSMDSDDAIGTLDSPQFKNGLRPVRRIFHARLPVFGADNRLVLLPAGYDADSQTLTLSEVEYDPDMTLEEALQVINDLFAEFDFADGEKTPGDGLKPTPRSKSVAVAAAVGLFVSALLPGTAQRPCFIICANAEGAGKGTLAKCCMMPTVGSVPTASKPNDENEIRKTLLTAVREAKTIIFFDNLKGHLSSESLEAFLTATIFEGRKLGVNEYIVAPNLATVFITGNGLTVSPDLRRRSLFIELHLQEERAEDKVFKRPLDEQVLLELRPKVLAALWALTKHWDRQGRPRPSRPHSAFSSWATIVGGIVEAAGFGCPLERADVSTAADPDGDDIRSLVSAMAQKLPMPSRRAGKTEWTFSELLNLAQEEGLFENILGTGDDGFQIDDDDGGRFNRSFRDGVGRKEKATLSKVFLRYNRRLVSGTDHNLFRFVVDGKGHSRRYIIEPQNELGKSG